MSICITTVRKRETFLRGGQSTARLDGAGLIPSVARDLDVVVGRSWLMRI